MRPTYTGLKIAPVIPTDWDGFTVTIVFRGVAYNIKVNRQNPGNNVALKVNGQPISGDIVPFPETGTEAVTVEVTLR